jgi:hypothetical protein
VGRCDEEPALTEVLDEAGIEARAAAELNGDLEIDAPGSRCLLLEAFGEGQDDLPPV